MKCINRAIHPAAFLMGWNEDIRVCDEFANVFGVPQVLPFITLITIMAKFAQRNFRIPSSHHSHFMPFSTVSSNLCSLIGTHAEFIASHLRGLRIYTPNPVYISLSNISVNIPLPLTSSPSLPPEFNSEQSEKVRACTICGFEGLEVLYQKSHSLGVFSRGHPLGSNMNTFCKLLFSIVTFSKGEYHMNCKKCKFLFDMRRGDCTQMITHAASHSPESLIFKENDTLISATKRIWKLICTRSFETNFEVCVPCNRFFPNLKYLVLHTSLFHRSVTKNVCLTCKKKFNGNMNTHIERYHPSENKCPFLCDVKPNLFVHHIIKAHAQNLRYPYALNDIEHSELIKLSKKSKFLQVVNSDTVIFNGKTLTLDVTFMNEIKAIVQYHGSNKDHINSYIRTDNLTGQILKSVIYARYQKLLLSPQIKALIMRAPIAAILNRLLLFFRYKYRQIIPQHSTTAIFSDIPQKFSLCVHTSMQKITDFELVNYQAVLIGNNLFRQVDTDRNEICLLNLTNPEPSYWKIGGLSMLSNRNAKFEENLNNALATLPMNCNHLIFVEASLSPILKTIPIQQRLTFLKENFKELAIQFIKNIIDISEHYRKVVIVTMPHTLFSAFHQEESLYVQMFNATITTIALRLDLYLMDFHQIGVFEVKENVNKPTFSTHSTYPFTILTDKEENLTIEGQNLIRKHFRDFHFEFKWLINCIK